MAGGSAGQSTLIQAFDVILGVEHFPTFGSSSSLYNGSNLEVQTLPPTHDGKQLKRSNIPFQTKMRLYMPKKHREFLEELGKEGTLNEYVKKHSHHQELVESFNRCVEALTDFRNKHIQIVTSYIVIPSHTEQDKNNEVRGTGGTSVIPFLKQSRDETLDCKYHT